MFIRSTRGYQEVCEAYRHPGTNKPTHRCIARWSSGRSLDEEIAVLEQAANYTAALLRRRPETLGPLEIPLYVGGSKHLETLRRRLEPFWRARDGLRR